MEIGVQSHSPHATAGQSCREIYDSQKSFFKTFQTRTYEFRYAALKRFERVLLAHESQVLRALGQDLGKSEAEAYMTEFAIVKNELRYFLKNLKTLMRPRRVATPFVLFHASSAVYHEPLGQVLVISPWNYPFNLALTPVIGAVAAGNCVMLKPSQRVSSTNAVIQKILTESFDPRHVSCVLGGHEVADELLELKWDFIFFTGSTDVGRKVYQKAAAQLTPVCLELGGKNPCLVDQTADLKLAARRLVWGKLINTGQTCIAPDHLYVHSSIRKAFAGELKKAIQEFYSESPEKHVDYPRLISKAKTEELLKLTQNEKVFLAGQPSSDMTKLGPWILEGVREDSPLMRQEIFGPLLPVLEFEDLDKLLENLNGKDKPLALYIFSNDSAAIQKVIERTSSGAVGINETLVHHANHNLPFGGVGTSGLQKYHGPYSFALFSNAKALLKKFNWIDIWIRYAPFEGKLKWIRKLL